MDLPLLCQVMFGRTVLSKAFNSYLVYRAALLFEEIVFLLWNHLKRNYHASHSKIVFETEIFSKLSQRLHCRMFDIDSANGHVMIVNHVTIFTHRMYINDALVIICGVMWAFFA